MEVLLLGTGSADGWPNAFCTCASCETERRAGRTRGQTSALVDGVVLLDCGPATPAAASRAGPVAGRAYGMSCSRTRTSTTRRRPPCCGVHGQGALNR